jgi:O-antigen ligase
LGFLIFVVLSFFYNPLPFLKWSSLFLAIILLAYLGKDFYLTFLETNVFKDLLSSVFDPSESSNSIRQDRWQAGINSFYNTFPFGRGVSFINEKALVGTGEIFENSWLCLHSGLGIIGLFYATFFFCLLIWFGFQGIRA